MRCAGRPAISWFSKAIEPALGRSVPAIKLKVVLLPDPFGPIRPRISPAATLNDTRLTARNPSKLLLTPLTESTSTPVAETPYRGRRLRPRRDGNRHQAAYGFDFGSGITSSAVLILSGQTIASTSPCACVTQAETRKFWPANSLPGGANLTP